MSSVNPGAGAGAPPPPQKSSGAKMACIIIAGVALCGGGGVVLILALIAVPNFLMFQCKSKQSEAKTNLSGLFTAEKAFYGEYNSYTSDLVALNWYPYGSEQNGPVYLYGFAYTGPDEDIPGIADYDPDRADSGHPDVVAGRYPTGRMVTSDGRALDADDLPEGSEVTRDRFVAAAVGNVDGDADLDIWTINEVKMLMVESNDCRP